MLTNAIHLVNNQTSEVIYQPLRQELIVKLKGIVSASQLGIIRSLVVQLFGNLKASTFVLDLENSEYQEFDFEDTEHKQFYKTAEKQGVKNFLLKYPNKYFHDQLKKQWKVFFEKNKDSGAIILILDVMKNHRIQLFHNQYRHIVYIPAAKKLITYWFGNVPESEQIKYIDYLQELIKIYEIDDFVINTKKVKTISLQPTRLLFERVLTKAYQQGAKTLTLIQKTVKNEAFVLNAYINALRSYGIQMKVELVSA